MKTETKILAAVFLGAALFTGCAGGGAARKAENADVKCGRTVTEVLPVTGTFINLAYQDVRNLYTNPPHIDNTDPQMWECKVREMKEMGMEYLVFMAVANDGLAYYPSGLMGQQYPQGRKSPVDAVMDAAADCGMKVFMSTGWAENQDDNLRDPAIRERQIAMMTELAGLYGEHPAFFGWYLPVEDCLGPVLTDYAVDAVNALAARARELVPEAKILISPYGIFNSDFDNPRYETQLSRLKVDIIAYQDEVGCVRERYPLTRLRANWLKLREIHDRTGVEMWANCESFAWEKGTNDRSSALIPAPFSRLLAQQAAATAGGVDRIISFMMCGIYENPSSPYQLGQPHWSGIAYGDYMAWLGGDRYWKAVEASFAGRLGERATEDAGDARWNVYEPGTHEIKADCEEDVREVLVSMLNSRKDGIVPPAKLFLFVADGCPPSTSSPLPAGTSEGVVWSLHQIKDVPSFPNDNHDAFVDHVLFDSIPAGTRHIKIAFTATSPSYFDEILVNPRI